MRVSAKTEYACIAMLELAGRYGSGEPVRIREIAQRHDIPQRFLVQILLQLKGAGLVASTRGATGGYQLLKPPEDITLADVVAVIEGPAQEFSAPTRDSPAARALQEAWRHVAQAQQAALAGLTLADLAAQARRQAENMYYI